jgi:hypothetical protein
MKKFKEHLPFLTREIDALCGEDVRIMPHTMLHILAGNGPAKDEADAACAHFCETLEWPDMSAEARADVVCRMLCTYWYCCYDQPDGVDEGMSGQESLRSFLCDYWDDTGRTDWVLEMILGYDSLKSQMVPIDPMERGSA